MVKSAGRWASFGLAAFPKPCVGVLAHGDNQNTVIASDQLCCLGLTCGLLQNALVVLGFFPEKGYPTHFLF